MTFKYPKTVFFVLLFVLAMTGYAAFKLMTPATRSGVLYPDDYSTFFPNERIEFIIYGTETCPHCTRARRDLEERDVDFLFRDIKDREYGRHFTELRGRSVPALLTRRQLIFGYAPEAVDVLLEDLETHFLDSELDQSKN